MITPEELNKMPSSLNDACRKMELAGEEIARLRAALAPFAILADGRDALPDDWEFRVEVRHLRAARAAQQSVPSEGK